MSDGALFGLFMGLAGVFIALLAGPIGRAIARRITGRKRAAGITTGEMTAERVAEHERRLADLEQAQARIAELEERLDFAERLLARSGGERPELAGGERQ